MVELDRFTVTLFLKLKKTQQQKGVSLPNNAVFTSWDALQTECRELGGEVRALHLGP